MLEQQLTNFLDNNNEHLYTMIHGDIPDEIYNAFFDICVISMDSYGGEDKGTEYYHIWQFSNSEEIVYIKFYGSYYSHIGVDDVEYTVVRPVEKTIIVYE